MCDRSTSPSSLPQSPRGWARRHDQTLHDRWRLKEALGAGSTGTVYRAERLDGGGDVAVKVLHPHAALGTTTRARFVRECELVTKLRHPNIIRFHALGELPDGALAMVMEYVHGESLAARMRRGPMPLPLVRHVVTEVAAALDHAHARGIVHRDLKPENVLVSPREGRALPDVKVVDFGLAKEGALGARVDISLRGEILGTPRYMSPERLCGGSVDARADVYALGLMTYEMLTGESPYRPARGVAGWADRHLFDDPTPIDAHPVSLALSAEARRTIMRALAKSRENRVDRAGELAACLREAPVLRAAPAPRRRGPCPRSEDRPRVLRMPALLVAALVAAILLVGGVLARQNDEGLTRRQPDPPALRDS